MVDYRDTLFLPKTAFPMKGNLPQKEKEILAYWKEIGLYETLEGPDRASRPLFVLHDGPPYANGRIHLGTALNKILKDMILRSKRMAGFRCPYVPGWDCHGLPIEWKVEEEHYRARGRSKPSLADLFATRLFRQECRQFASHWLGEQREDFRRLGILGDWDRPYRTMDFAAEARIAQELLTFARTGLLYRGLKPVLWSVVEQTTLAEAEIEYQEVTSPSCVIAFPFWSLHLRHEPGTPPPRLLIWTSTPWTLPANRAVAFSPDISYGLYRVTQIAEGTSLQLGQRYLIAQKQADSLFEACHAQAVCEQVLAPEVLRQAVCAHPLGGSPFPQAQAYDFFVPVLEGTHVTEETGTGFVHIAPSHGREDYDLWQEKAALWASEMPQDFLSHLWTARGCAFHPLYLSIPETVDAASCLTAPGFEGRIVFTPKGAPGDANEAVLTALSAQGAVIQRRPLRHLYPHSWRSKKPLLFRSTPQWFIALDRPFSLPGETEAPRSLRARALAAIQKTSWYPSSGRTRLSAMVRQRPDWVVSRQRAWGVPLPLFVHKKTKDILLDETVFSAIIEAFRQEGADAWFSEDAAARFLGPGYDPSDYEMVYDVLDVWFDSGSTHAFVLEDPEAFPAFKDLKRGKTPVLYVEGSDQHRGWFQASLLESCGTRGVAPYDQVLTHGFVLDEKGYKMSKSLGNVIVPQSEVDKRGADILRLWIASSDYTDDLKVGPAILEGVAETYRKWRNILRWILGALAHVRSGDLTWANPGSFPPLEQWMLARVNHLTIEIRQAYEAYDIKRVVELLAPFLSQDVSAFYCDVRKDCLYCESPLSWKRRSALAFLHMLMMRLLTWLAPILPFTTEEAYQALRQTYQGKLSWELDEPSVHGLSFLETVPLHEADEHLILRWGRIRRVRLVITGALEKAREEKRIGSSLEASARVFVTDPYLLTALQLLGEEDLRDLCLVSHLSVGAEETGPADAFRLAEVPGIAVQIDVLREEDGWKKCARSWRMTQDVGSDPAYPDVSARDAQALREWAELNQSGPSS